MNEPTKVEADIGTKLQNIIAEDRASITNDSMQPYYEAMTGTHSKLVQAMQHKDEADANIDRLEKELAGWRRFGDYQGKRIPALQRRYETARDHVRATEDEQAGIP